MSKTHNQTQALLAAVERFSGVPMMVIGDLIVDHYVWGKVNRISPEAPVLVVNVNKESRRLGGAGNVAHNLVNLGAKVRVCGVVGDDEPGRDLCQQLQRLGIDTSGIVVDSSRPTTVKTRVIAHAQQVVRVDREVSKPVSSEVSAKLSSALSGALASVKGVVVSDYAKGVVNTELFKLIDQQHRAGAVGPKGIPVLVDPKAPNFPLYTGATIIKPNRAEAEAAAGIEISSRADAVRAGEQLIGRWGCEMVLITLGEDGMVLISRDANGKGFSSFEVDTVAREVYDVSGAGDTVSAVFTLALAAGAELSDAAKLANFGAGVVVREVGTVPVRLDELCEAIKHGGDD